MKTRCLLLLIALCAYMIPTWGLTITQDSSCMEGEGVKPVVTLEDLYFFKFFPTNITHRNTTNLSPSITNSREKEWTLALPQIELNRQLGMHMRVSAPEGYTITIDSGNSTGSSNTKSVEYYTTIPGTITLSCSLIGSTPSGSLGAPAP